MPGKGILTFLCAVFEDGVESNVRGEDIEACVFTHKAILLGDKTLIDTVQQPKEDWSLKAAKKLKSCLCCSHGEENDEDEENNNGELSKPKLEMDLSVPRCQKAVSKYIDGKAQFAFDPTKFSK